MKTHIQLAALLLAFATCGVHQATAQDDAAAEHAEPKITLKVGDKAPEFKVTQWFKGEPVTLDDKGTFIVECWATWCGPCIAAFPHLSEVAKANEGKITVVGVNVWERKTMDEVKEFVKDQGDKMSYHVAEDGDKVITEKWLAAAGKNGIPCAFVVSKGKVAWIGHPMGLKQDLLDSIVDGSFDSAAFQKAEDQQQAVQAYFAENVVPALRKKDNAAALVALEKMKTEFPDEAKNVDGFIERLKAAPKEPEAKKTEE
jgi:thiol-disulfide isomerase/thioredoxin